MSTPQSNPTPRPGRSWPFLAAAAAAAAAGIWLVTPHDAGQEKAPAAAASSVAATPAPAPSSASSSQAPVPSSVEPTPSQGQETDREKGTESGAPTSGNVQVSPTSTSAARSEQIKVEQQAQQRATQGLDTQAKEKAEARAREFVQAWNERSWQTQRKDWAAALKKLASPAVVAEVNKDADWDSSAWQRVVDAQATTSAEVLRSQAQNVQGESIEVAVTVATTTTSNDPWVSTPRTERELTVVVDPDGGKVVQQIDMTPRGGL